MSDYSIAIKIGGQLEGSFNSALRAARGGLSGLGSSATQNTMVTSRMSSSLSKGMMAAGAAVSAVAKGVEIAGKAVADVGKYSVQVGKDFESAMSSASATANASAADYEKMKQAAMEMGKTTSKTATESAQALEYMALAGWDVDTSVSALPSVLKMSEATGMDLARTSDLTTDSMAALGVTVDQLPGYLDVAAKAQTKSNQTAEQLMEAYLGVGGTMKNLNVPVTESATALGVLANRGIKGSEAGNALNAIMVNLTTGTGQAGKMMQELGVSAFDSQGNFIGLEATLQQLNGALQGCSEEERNAAMAAIGGKQHVDALNDLMAGLNTTNEEGVTEWAALKGELDNCNGSLDAMRDKKLDNLEGDLATLQSATQDAGIKIYEHLNGPLREFAQFGTQAVYQVSDALESGGFSGMAGAIGGVISDGLAMIVSKAPAFLEMGLNMIASFGQGLAKNASGIAQSLMSLIGTAIVTVIKNAPKNFLALGSMAVGLIKGVMISIGNGIKQAIPQILTLIPVLFAKLLGSILHAAPKLITAIPGIIKTAFGAILKLNPISIGVSLMKAIIKGIISMGKNVLKAFKDAIFGGGDDKADAEKAGAEAAKGYADGANGDAEATNGALSGPGDAAAMAEAGVMGGDALKAGEEQAKAGVPLDAALPEKGADGAGESAPAIADAAPALKAAADTGMGVTDMPGLEAQFGGGAVPADALPAPTEGLGPIPSSEMASVANMPLTETAETGAAEGDALPPVGAVQAETEAIQTAPDAPPEAMQATSEAVSDVSLGDIQAPVDGAMGAPTEAVQAETEAVSDMAPGYMRTATDIAADTPPEEVKVPAGAVTDTSTGMGQSLDAAQAAGTAGAGAMAQPDNTSAVSGLPGIGMFQTAMAAGQAADSGGTPDTAAQPAGTAQIPPNGDAASAAGNAMQPGDAPQAGGANAPRVGLASAALSSRMGLAAVMDGVGQVVAGIRQNVAGIVNASPAGAVMAVIKGESAAAGAQDAAQGADGAAAPPPEMTPPAGSLAGAGQPPAESMEGISGKTQETADMAQARPVEAESGGLDATTQKQGTPSRSTGIRAALDKLSGGFPSPGTPAPGGTPTFTLTQTFHISGGDNTKEDVAEAAQMGVREFDKLMQKWMRQNKRGAFGKAMTWT